MAMIVTFSGALTAGVVIEKVALFAPGGIVTDAGTAARFGSELASVTMSPPAGAFHPGVSATVPCAALPPVTVADERTRL